VAKSMHSTRIDRSTTSNPCSSASRTPPRVRASSQFFYQPLPPLRLRCGAKSARGGRYRRNWRFRELPGRGQGNLAATGIVIGLSGALAATRILRTLLYEVKPSDPQTYSGDSALLVALATLASYLPAHRASRVEPSFP